MDCKIAFNQRRQAKQVIAPTKLPILSESNIPDNYPSSCTTLYRMMYGIKSQKGKNAFEIVR